MKPMTFSSEYTLVGNDHLTENEYRRASLKMYDVGERFRQPEGKDYQDIYSHYGLLADPHSIYERPGMTYALRTIATEESWPEST